MTAARSCRVHVFGLGERLVDRLREAEAVAIVRGVRRGIEQDGDPIPLRSASHGAAR